MTWTIRERGRTPSSLTHLDAARAAGRDPEPGPGTAGTTDGVLLPVGIYTSYVTASDGTVTISQSVEGRDERLLDRDLDRRAAPGRQVTVTVTSAEPLTGRVRLYVTQPGISTGMLTMTQGRQPDVAATITLKYGGSAGTLKLMVWVDGLDGRTQATTRTCRSS